MEKPGVGATCVGPGFHEDAADVVFVPKDLMWGQNQGKQSRGVCSTVICVQEAKMRSRL